MRLGSHVFFHGLAVGETNKVNIADGKTLVIKYLGLGEVDKEGMRTVSFELNGIRRDVQVPDEEAQKILVDCLAEAIEWANGELAAVDSQYKEEMEANGAIFVDVDKEDWREAATPGIEEVLAGMDPLAQEYVDNYMAG